MPFPDPRQLNEGLRAMSLQSGFSAYYVMAGSVAGRTLSAVKLVLS
jgi:hypothetical protein